MRAARAPESIQDPGHVDSLLEKRAVDRRDRSGRGEGDAGASLTRGPWLNLAVIFLLVYAVAIATVGPARRAAQVRPPRRFATSDLALRKTRSRGCGKSLQRCGCAPTFGEVLARTVEVRHSTKERTRWQAHTAPSYRRPRETDSGAFFKVATVLLGILVAVIGLFALLMWADARKTDNATEVAVTALNRAAPQDSATGHAGHTQAADHNTALPLDSFAGVVPENADALAEAHAPD